MINVIKKYPYKFVADIEDDDGVCLYNITVLKPIPDNIMEDLKRNIIGIGRLEFLSKLHGFTYKAIETDEEWDEFFGE